VAWPALYRSSALPIGLRRRLCLGALVFAVGFALPHTLFRENHGRQPAFQGLEASSPTQLLNRNLRAAVYTASGLFTFGVGTGAALFMQGWDLGRVTARASGTGSSISLILVALVPHGVLEYLALLMVAAAGLLPLEMIWSLLDSKPVRPIWRPVARELMTTVALALVLFGAAALIEATVTPRLILWWMRT
jgi:uncharacterized membrane protein SpoIIM required for sporulation